jgi:subtilisin-like proprotein convertase family protein
VPLTVGVPYTGSAADATNDGDSDCNLDLAPDVYHTFMPAVAGVYTFSLCTGTAWDTVLSLHAGCPADLTTLVACDDEGCRPAGASDFGYPSSLTVTLAAGAPYIVRVSAYDSLTPGDVYTLTVVGPATPTGACCLQGQCSVQTQAVCALAGAQYRGDYTVCAAPAGVLAYYPGSTTPAAIPDNSMTGVTSTVNVPDTFAVGDVRLELNLTHTFVGDLTITLTHGTPSRTATIMERVGGGQYGDDSNFAGLYTFIDSAGQTIWAAADAALDTNSTIPPGSYRAADRYANTVSLRSMFAGMPATGTWTLHVADTSATDTGTLNSWRLVLDHSAGNPCDTSSGACCNGSTCQIMAGTDCTGFAHRFVGPATACNAPGNGTTPCCKADFNQTGTITVQDVFDYLDAYFRALPTADYNGSGLSLQDLFDFLTGFFGGCG